MRWRLEMTTSKLCTLTLAGYTVLALAMLAFLTINGVSDTGVGTIGTAGLIGVGLVLPAAAMLVVARRVDPSGGTARKGLVLQSLGLLGLLIGLLMSFFASSLSGHLLSGVFIALAGISGVVGAIFFSKDKGVPQIVVGAVLIAIGAALIPASNIAAQSGWALDLDKSVYQDIGSTLVACGCVAAAYSSFLLRKPLVSR